MPVWVMSEFVNWTVSRLTSKNVTFPWGTVFKGVTVPWGTVLWKYITKLFIFSKEISTHFPNGCGMPYESLEWESQILKFPSEVLKIATMLQSTVNRQCW